MLHSVNAPTLSTRLGNGNTTLLAAGSGPNGLGAGGTMSGHQQAAPGAGAAAVLHRRSSPNSSSAYSQSQWRVQKDNMSGVGRCSWKFVAIFFMLLSVILVSALIYTTGRTKKNPTTASRLATLQRQPGGGLHYQLNLKLLASRPAINLGTRRMMRAMRVSSASI